MADLKELLQSADWKTEKHVPLIEFQDNVKKGELFKATVSVGKEISHPNTTEHHISWMEVYFLPEGEKSPYQIGRYEFTSHGASTQGPNTSTVYAEPIVEIYFKTDKPGTVLSSSYCNIHGLWQSSKELTIN